MAASSLKSTRLPADAFHRKLPPFVNWVYTHPILTPPPDRHRRPDKYLFQLRHHTRGVRGESDFKSAQGQQDGRWLHVTSRLSTKPRQQPHTYPPHPTSYDPFQVQRYEGGFTLFGPHTLAAYIQTITNLATQLVTRAPPAAVTVTPPDLGPRQVSLLADALLDTVPWVSRFGEVVVDAGGVYRPGEKVEVTFR
jgi:hypothetical protein